jgi:hypothetical protein
MLQMGPYAGGQGQLHGTTAARGCQKPFNLEGVDYNVDSRCKVILDLLKSELLLENIK